MNDFFLAGFQLKKKKQGVVYFMRYECPSINEGHFFSLVEMYRPIKKLYKNSFLRKKSSRARVALDLARMEKGIWNPRQYGTKKLLPLFVENYCQTLRTNSGTQTVVRKN